ncbi:MAG TPA: hypothetical protein VGX51_06725 [Solirubrobacteraceae bacterium]|nr:hypothetical protein [Solirubrobacteraceae bacterium]
MPAVLRRAALEGLTHPLLLAELPKGVRARVERAVKQAGSGDYGSIRLGDSALAVRQAAKTLQSKPRVPKKLAAVLPELERIPGY